MDPEKINGLTDPKGLRNVMKNARTRGREDLYWVAFKRLCSLQGMNVENPLERDFYAVLAAYEELLSEKNGRTTKANRTRQKIKNRGIQQCLSDWATGQPTDGFKFLVAKGQPELTAEYLVIKFADRFDHKVVESARKRLSDAGPDGSGS